METAYKRLIVAYFIGLVCKDADASCVPYKNLKRHLAKRDKLSLLPLLDRAAMDKALMLFVESGLK